VWCGGGRLGREGARWGGGGGGRRGGRSVRGGGGEGWGGGGGERDMEREIMRVWTSSLYINTYK